MKTNHMLKYYISIILAFNFFISSFSQTETDSISIKNKFGLRAGVDLSKILNSAFNDDYEGFEINADLRILKNIYISAEIGTEKKIISNDYLNTEAKGNYLKAGGDYNMYTNWLGMDNLIYSGFRIGFSNFSQTINSYTIYDINNQPWGQATYYNPIVNDNLNALWMEFIVGIKTQVLNNLFLGFNIQLKNLISDKTKNNIDNIYIPGFNRTYDSSSLGSGFSYSISYLVPIIKK
ncbi:MAG: hypothetical protein EVA44_00310 [Flavobacteriales bacterium]|nr:MAG: hypothetical protein EVA44_00310 [Flavobacteriales bacterium]